MTMRASFVGTLVLLVSLSSTAGPTDEACAPITAFIEKLAAGEHPAEFPDPTSCDKEFAPELAKALAIYVQSHSSSDVATVVAMIRTSFRKAERKTAFGNLAAAVQKELASTGFELPRTDDKYALLDSLPLQAKPIPVTTSAPPPKPSPTTTTPTATAPPVATLASASGGSGPAPLPPSPFAGVVVLWTVRLVFGAALAGVLL